MKTKVHVYTQEQRIACKHIHDLLAVAIHLAEENSLMGFAGEIRTIADTIKMDIKAQRDDIR